MPLGKKTIRIQKLLSLFKKAHVNLMEMLNLKENCSLVTLPALMWILRID